MSASESTGTVRALIVFAVVAFGAVILTGGLVFWKMVHPDHTRFSEAVDVVVTDSELATNRRMASLPDYWVTYQYEVDGQRYERREIAIDGAWKPGQPLSACVDPADPAEHVALIERGARCGDENLGNKVRTARRVD